MSSAAVLAPYVVAFIQTEFNPNYVRGCIEKFFEDHLAFVEESMPQEE